MAEKNKLYEVTRLLNNTEPLNEEIYSALDTLKSCFQKNYVRKVYMAADSEEKKVKENPSREIVLLRALKGFSNETQHHSIDSTIDMLNLLQTAQNIQSELVHIKADEKPISIRSEEGTEMTISNESVQTTGLLMLLALMKKL